MRIKIIAFLGFIFLFPEISKSKSLNKEICPDWEKRFSERTQNILDSRKEIENWFQSEFKDKLPICPEVAPQVKKQEPKIIPKHRVSTLQLNSIKEFKKLAKKFPRYKYIILPAKKRPQNKDTVILFAGGPGSVDSKYLAGNQLDEYQVLIADYLGMGLNEIKDIRAGVDDQYFDLDHHARIIHQIIKNEKKHKRINNYILWGHSFGSESAIIVGSYLSQLKNKQERPLAILAGGVFDFYSPTKEEQWGKILDPSQIRKGDNGETEAVPKRMVDQWCVLPDGPTSNDCLDNSVLNLLKVDEKKVATEKIQKLFKNYSDFSHATTEQYLFRDAFHREVITNVENAAKFLRRYITKDDHSDLYCWYKKNYADIPWRRLGGSASLRASSDSLTCHRWRGYDWCACFKNTHAFDDSYQIADSTPIYYVNGENDSQTPIDGALANYNKQKTANKYFLKVPGGGHYIYELPPF